MDPKILDDFARTLSEAVPKGLRDLQHDMEKNMRAALEGSFDRLNLVTREQFEVQAGVLARTRAKVEALEQRVAALEAQLLEKKGPRKAD